MRGRLAELDDSPEDAGQDLYGVRAKEGGTGASMPAGFSVPPVMKRSPRTTILGRFKLECHPLQVGVEAIVEDFGMCHEGVIVWQ